MYDVNYIFYSRKKSAFCFEMGQYDRFLKIISLFRIHIVYFN